MAQCLCLLYISFSRDRFMCAKCSSLCSLATGERGSNGGWPFRGLSKALVLNDASLCCRSQSRTSRRISCRGNRQQSRACGGQPALMLLVSRRRRQDVGRASPPRNPRTSRRRRRSNRSGRSWIRQGNVVPHAGARYSALGSHTDRSRPSSISKSSLWSPARCTVASARMLPPQLVLLAQRFMLAFFGVIPCRLTLGCFWLEELPERL